MSTGQHSRNFFEVEIALVEGEDGTIVELLPSPYAARRRQDGLNRAAKDLADREGLALIPDGEPFWIAPHHAAPITISKPNRRRRLARVIHSLGL